MKFQKENEIEWKCRHYRIVRQDGLEGPEYEVFYKDQSIGTYRLWFIAKLACEDREKAA